MREKKIQRLSPKSINLVLGNEKEKSRRPSSEAREKARGGIFESQGKKMLQEEKKE